MAEASNFKFSTQLEFVKTHHKITPRGKSGRDPGIGELPKILEFSIIFLQWLKLATSNSMHSWGLPRPIIKSHREEKGGVTSRIGELPKIWRFPFNIYIVAEASNFIIGMQLGFVKADHKITSKRKSGRGLGLGSSPKFWGSPIIFRLKLATSKLACGWGLPSPS